MAKITATINDLSGLGQSSLCAIIPILSVMGIQACPLPTAVLSSQTDGYHDYAFLDMSPLWADYIAHWQKEAPPFACIYSGFLGSVGQIEMIRQFIADFARKDTLIIVDPVLGDNGKLYDTMNEKMVQAMRSLITQAHVITPNYTEMCLLSSRQYNSSPDIAWLKEEMLALSALGPKVVVVTSIPAEDKKTTLTAIYDSYTKEYSFISTQLLPAHYPGSGDIFCAVLVGGLLNDLAVVPSVKKAADFVYEAINLSLKQNRPFREGVALEQALPLLYKK